MTHTGSAIPLAGAPVWTGNVWVQDYYPEWLDDLTDDVSVCCIRLQTPEIGTMAKHIESSPHHRRMRPMGVSLKRRSRTSNPSSEAKSNYPCPTNSTPPKHFNSTVISSPVMEGFSPPGASITES
ncbi:MAG TPA: hypothetical protein VKN18_31710 [Blastocatellia bacterium]|nr:hypothetical protein [Blastocatellia bacterium]